MARHQGSREEGMWLGGSSLLPWPAEEVQSWELGLLQAARGREGWGGNGLKGFFIFLFSKYSQLASVPAASLDLCSGKSSKRTSLVMS